MSNPIAAVDRFPRVRLGHAPTPLDPAPRLGAALGIELWVKR
ncbi:MAG: D-cysteine desulfhydrase family protein, partial [Acidobacteria bacterium]|nr:D-cysteine desulfhydrase family protein [Acidobacteriota bacterium]